MDGKVAKVGKGERPGADRVGAASRGLRLRDIPAGLAMLAVVLTAGPAPALVTRPDVSSPAVASGSAEAVQLAGKVESGGHNGRRGSSAEVYGGSSADRYGGSSADKGGVGGRRDRRVYGKPNRPDTKAPPRKNPASDADHQDREDEDRPEAR